MKQRYKLLIVDDEVSFSNLLRRELEDSGSYTIELAFDGAEAINKVQNTLYDLVLLDIRLPRIEGTEVLKFLKEHTPTTPVIIITGNTDVSIAIQSMKLGAYDYIIKPYDIDELQSTIERALERKKLFIDNTLMRNELSRKTGPSEIIGQSETLRKVVERALKVAQSESIVLIQGASGTGKELIAHLIHKNSPRSERPFVTVNCASIPDTLLESELFGHEKGAFTSAYATKQGLVEVANGGTLFLDEVGDISPTIQPKLLRFLETGNFRRVGGVNELNVDVRIISATNKNLEQEARAGRFREDLLYRLNVFTLHIPTLHERKEDIPLLVDHFLKLKAKSKTVKTMSPQAMNMLTQHDWPGNIREIEHVIEGAMIMSHDDVIQPKDLLLPAQSPSSTLPKTSEVTTENSSILPIEELEKQHIEAALKHFNGNRTKTAQSLRISQKTLYLKIKRYGIKVE
jgi:two-component system response regulator AtoC